VHVLTRRSVLRSLGSGLLVAAAAPVVVEPFVRSLWAVPRSAPVGTRGTALTAAELRALDRLRDEVLGAIYRGQTVTLGPDGAKAAASHRGAQPVGFVERVNDDGTAWVRLGGQRFDPLTERDANGVGRAEAHVSRIAGLRFAGDSALQDAGFGFVDMPVLREWLGPKVTA
jgi:hypothetical protein